MANKLGIENFGRGRLLLPIGKASLLAMGSTLRLERKLMMKEASIEKRLTTETSITVYLHIYIQCACDCSGPFLLSDTLTLNPKHGKHKNIPEPIKGCSYCIWNGFLKST